MHLTLLRGLQAIHCIVTNTYNQFLSKMLVGYMITLLTLFANFFARKYFKKDPKGKLA
jgi:GNS1/SUR4 family